MGLRLRRPCHRRRQEAKLPARVILAVHGVRTAGAWGDQLYDRLRETLTTPFYYDTLDYPWLPAVVGWGATWFP